MSYALPELPLNQESEVNMLEVCGTQNTRSIIIHNCIGLTHIDMPHMHTMTLR